MQLRVVTPEQLLNELLRRMHEQRLELERMISQEEQLAQGLSGADLKTLERAPGAQRDVARTVLRASRVLADAAIAGFSVQESGLEDALRRNPILVTALNPVIGSEKGAAIDSLVNVKLPPS